MCVNSFTISDQELHSIGTGIYLAASIVDHSCKPNAVVTFEGTTLFMHSLENMPFLDWSKVLKCCFTSKQITYSCPQIYRYL